MGRFWFLLILFLQTVTLYSQNPGKYKLQKISVDKGLSQSVVTSIAQDSLGFMWFATQDGINRYDGYHFDNFYNQKANPYSLSNNFVNAILCDYSNEIWVATLDGVCKYDYTTEHFTVFRHDANNPSSLSNNEVTCLAVSKTGNIWMGTNNGGINLFDKKKKSFSHYRFEPDNPRSISSDNITVLYEDRNDKLWVGHYNGLDCIDLKSGKINHIRIFNDPKTAALYDHIRCFYQDTYGNNWIGTDNGLVFQNVKNNTFKIYSYNPQSPCSVNGNLINCVTCDSENNLWVGTEENGLNFIKLSSFYASESNVCFNQIRMRENEYGLSIRSVLSIYVDGDKNIWVGTYSGGINFISSFSEKFQKYQHSPYDKNTISYPKIWGLCEDKNGNIWIGTDGAGLDMLNQKTGKLTHYEHNKSNPATISDNAILCALRDHTNTLWFGTYAGGLNRFNESSKTFTSYKANSGSPNGLPINDVRALYEDVFHTIWIGTNNGGLCRYNSDKNNFSVFNLTNSSISIGNIRAITGDKNGNLYLGTYSRGLDIYNPRTGKTLNFSHQRNQPNSISDNYVYALALANDDNIWVGTGNGLNLFHPSTKTFEVFDERNGLANNFIHAILIDKNGDLWVSTNKGISKFIVSEKKFQNFNAYDGLQSGEFNDGSALYSANGQMWFGGINGLNVFVPGNVSKSSFQPKVVIRGLQLYNTPVKARTPENPESPLPASISTARQVVLNYRQSVFTIDFVALNYSFPEKTQYAFRLKGLDHEWNEAGIRRSASYRDLPAGSYVFEVRASNQDGFWSDKTASIEIIVKPPIWKTWWAYLIYSIILASIVYVIYNYYKERLALKNKLMLEQVSHLKDLELNQERFRFFTNISHEFRTPLTLILGPIEELLEKEDQQSAMGRKFVLIYKNARKLLELINMLLDFRKVESGNMELRASQGDLVKFSRDLVETFRDMASQKGIDLQFNTTSERIDAWFDREKFEIIFNNLLSNAFKFTLRGGSIKVDIQERAPKFLTVADEIIAITVTDNGIGIAQKHIDHIFDSYYSLEHSEGIKGTGIGLALTKSLVEMHKGRIVVEAAEKQGSSFIIEIPKGSSHIDEESLATVSQEVDEAKPNKTIVIEGQKEEPIREADDNLADRKIMLIVEDNEDVRSYIVSGFSDKYRVLQADTGVTGYGLACKHVPDIIISDVMMPEMDGIEFCHKIKSTIATCHIPVILLTARSSITHKKEGYEIGADSYVTKPFSVELLEIRVENLLKSRKQLKDYYTRTMLFQQAAVISESPDEKFMKQLIELVEKYMGEPDFDVQKLTNELNMSRPVLYRKVKALTDLSIVEFVRTVRMNKAAQLLKTGQYRVSDVAFEVGFNDLKYFRQCFKDQFNITPSDLIRSQNPDQSIDN